jgi:hypothetical protein
VRTYLDRPVNVEFCVSRPGENRERPPAPAAAKAPIPDEPACLCTDAAVFRAQRPIPPSTSSWWGGATPLPTKRHRPCPRETSTGTTAVLPFRCGPRQEPHIPCIGNTGPLRAARDISALHYASTRDFTQDYVPFGERTTA